jgi:uncharacterized protein YndB with AHSA1/START domain
MPSARQQVTIQQPAADVFACIADGLNDTKWRVGILNISNVSGSGVGTIYQQGVRGPGGRRVDADYRVTVFEHGRRLAFETIAGPVRPTGEYVLEDVGGATRVTFTLQASLGTLERLLMGGMVQRTMDAEGASLANLKRVLEAS